MSIINIRVIKSSFSDYNSIFHSTNQNCLQISTKKLTFKLTQKNIYRTELLQCSLIFISMSKSKYQRTLILRITEEQLKYIIEESLIQNLTHSEVVRETINYKLNSKKSWQEKN